MTRHARFSCCTALRLSAQVITSLKRKESVIAEIHLSEGQRLRVLRLGLFEVLRDVIPLPEDCSATCATRLLRLKCPFKSFESQKIQSSQRFTYHGSGAGVDGLNASNLESVQELRSVLVGGACAGDETPLSWNPSWLIRVD